MTEEEEEVKAELSKSERITLALEDLGGGLPFCDPWDLDEALWSHGLLIVDRETFANIEGRIQELEDELSILEEAGQWN